MLRIITLNVNGLRSATQKGLLDWLPKQRADIICLQEIRIQANQLESQFDLAGYDAYFTHAEKKGYSGVAIYTRYKPDHCIMQLGWTVADQEGRYLQLDFGNLSIVSLYLPSGTSGDIRQQCKFEFLNRYQKILEHQLQDGRDYIICGDWNIAHHAIDLRNWKANQKNSGFLPEERAWLDTVLGPLGYVDAFRLVEPGPDHYTWWSHRGQARHKNVGWRIDYQMISQTLRNKVLDAAIYKEPFFSDHAPLVIDYALNLDTHFQENHD